MAEMVNGGRTIPTRWILLAVCLATVALQESSADIFTFGDVPIMNVLSKLDMGRDLREKLFGKLPKFEFNMNQITMDDIKDVQRDLFQATNSNGILEWLKVLIKFIKPFLDPLFIGHLGIDVNEEDVTAHATGDVLTIRHLLSTKISNLTVESNRLGVTANLTFPKIGLDGLYNLTGYVRDLDTHIFGNGLLRVTLIDFSVYGSLRLYIGRTLDLKVENLDYSVKGLDVFLENILGGGAVSELINRIACDIGPIVLHEFKPNVTTMVTNTINKALAKLIPK